MIRRPAGPVLLVGGLLGAAAVAAGFSTLEVRGRSEPWQLPPPPPVPPEPPPAAPELAEPATHDSGWLGQLVLLVGLLLATVLLGLLVWALVRWLRRAVWLRPAWLRLHRLPAASVRVTTGPVAIVPEEELLAAVDEAVGRAGEVSDPRRAVIACWVRLADAAGAAGVPRYESDTATDLVLRVLRGHQVSEPVLAGFADVYRRARYASDPVTEPIREQARAALARLRSELRSSRVGGS